MAPSAALCPGCQKPFYGKQRRTACSVCCINFHAESCVPKLKSSQVFVCVACKCAASPRLNVSLGSSPPNPRTSSGGEAVLTPSALVDILNEFFTAGQSLHRQGNSSVDSMGAAVDLLTDLVRSLHDDKAAYLAQAKSLRDEVGMLRDEVRSLRQVVDSGPVTIAMSRPYEAVAVPDPQSTSTSAPGGSGELAAAAKGNSKAGSYSKAATLGMKVTSDSTGRGSSRPPPPLRQSGPPKPSHRTTKTRPVSQELVVGRRSTPSSLKSAAKPTPAQVSLPCSSRCLFITRAAKCETPETVGTYLQEVFQLSSFVCTKLKTLHDSCSSFHLAVPEAEFTQLLDAEMWPTKVLVHPFDGHLLCRQVSATTTWSSAAPTPTGSSILSISGNAVPIHAIASSVPSPTTSNDESV